MTTPSAPPAEAPQKKGNCFLWGCLSVIILFFVVLCCLGSLFLLPFFTDFDPLGIDLRNRIEEYIPWTDFLEDPSVVPDLPDVFDDPSDPATDESPGDTTTVGPASGASDPATDESPGDTTTVGPASGAQAISLSTYVPTDFQAVFDYPTGWEIETEEYGVTFYDTQSYTYLYVGEDLVEEGMTAQLIAEDVRDSLIEEAQEGTFKVFESTPFYVQTGDDAYLIAYEFTDSEGYYQWALDLETVSGDSNIFFYLSGEDPTDYELYRELIEIIASSFSR